MTTKHPNGHRWLSVSEAKAAGWTVDDTIYPLRAWRGAPGAGAELTTVIPDEWALDIDQLLQFRKRPPTPEELAFVEKALVRFYTSDGRVTPLPISDEMVFRNMSGARFSVVRVVITIPDLVSLDWVPPPPGRLPTPLDVMKAITLKGLKTELAANIVDLIRATEKAKKTTVN